MLAARHVTQSIARSPQDVYAFASNAKNLPKWAAGLETLGNIQIQHAPPNSFGVLDHDVTLPNGPTVHNPFRVLPNEGGSEVVFTVFRQPGVSDSDFEKDCAAVAKDLAKLAQVTEALPPQTAKRAVLIIGFHWDVPGLPAPSNCDKNPTQ